MVTSAMRSCRSATIRGGERLADRAAQLAVPGWVHPHEVALLEQGQIVLGRDEMGEIRGERRGVVLRRPGVR